jgi:cyanate permease
MFITLGVYTCVYSVSLFLPSIVRTLGYTNNDSQLMTVPPYVVACFFCIFCNWMADKQKQRGVWMIGCCVTG